MPTFKDLWTYHPGHAFICDQKAFPNQCAIRLGVAIEAAGGKIDRTGIRTCVGYDRRTFAAHAPGHIRAAQQLADYLVKRPETLGVGVTVAKMEGTMLKNVMSLRNRKGVIFILNGWGRTDHIDAFDGSMFLLKGGDSSYLSVGEAVWFWEMPC